MSKIYSTTVSCSFRFLSAHAISPAFILRPYFIRRSSSKLFNGLIFLLSFACMVTADVYITLNSVLYEQNGCSGVRNIFRLQLNLVNISNIISRPPFFNSLNFKVIIINIKYLVFIWIAFPAYAVFNILSKLLILKIYCCSEIFCITFVKHAILTFHIADRFGIQSSPILGGTFYKLTIFYLYPCSVI